MLITAEELKSFSGNYDSENADSYIKSAQDLIETSIGFNPETNEEWKDTIKTEIDVWSDDGETFYLDEDMTILADIPEGADVQPTLTEDMYCYFIDEEVIVVPELIKLVCKEIATLMQLEENQNLGINSKSFGDSGTRSFLNVTNYDQYLKKLSKYKRGGALKF